MNLHYGYASRDHVRILALIFLCVQCYPETNRRKGNNLLGNHLSKKLYTRKTAVDGIAIITDFTNSAPTQELLYSPTVG